MRSARPGADSGRDVDSTGRVLPSTDPPRFGRGCSFSRTAPGPRRAGRGRRRGRCLRPVRLSWQQPDPTRTQATPSPAPRRLAGRFLDGRDGYQAPHGWGPWVSRHHPAPTLFFRHGLGHRQGMCFGRSSQAGPRGRGADATRLAESIRDSEPSMEETSPSATSATSVARVAREAHGR